MKVTRFHYELPEDLIAQRPLAERDSSRLMTISRHTGEIRTAGAFRQIKALLGKGDLLVMNNTRVVKVRLYGHRETGGKVEIFVTDPFRNGPPYEALAKSSGRLQPGEKVRLESGHYAEIMQKGELGFKVRFSAELEEVLRAGHVPLPPYIKRPDEPGDGSRYQTVYATSPGATAAPTAGLHFTEELLRDLDRKGVERAFVTLHTGFGTFAPVRSENVEEHKMHSEFYSLSPDAADKINRAKSLGKRIIAVGSTSVRVLETVSKEHGDLVPGSGDTELYIYPPYQFKVVDGIITNFHLPGSTLLMMMCAFGGEELVLSAYRKAVKEKYRFFSYGDAMFIT